MTQRDLREHEVRAPTSGFQKVKPELSHRITPETVGGLINEDN